MLWQEKWQIFSGNALGWLMFLMAPVLLFAPVQSSVQLFLIALVAIPFFRLPDLRSGGLLPVLLAFFLFMLWSGISYFWSDHNGLVVERLIKLAVGVPFIFLWCNVDMAGLRRHVNPGRWLMAGFVLAAAVALADMAGGLALSGWLQDFRGKGFEVNMLKPGLSMVTMLGLVLLYTRPITQRLPALLLAGLILVILFHPAQMLAVRAAAAFSVAAWICIRLFPRCGPMALLAVGGLILFLFPLLFRAEYLSFLTETMSRPPYSLLHRLVIWEHVRELTDAQFWFGYGLGSSRYLSEGLLAQVSSLPEAFQTYRPWIGYLARNDVMLLPLHPHNLGLQIALETGFVGLVLVFLLFAMVVRALHGALDQESWRYCFPVFVLLLAATCFSFSIWQSWWLALLILLFGIARMLGFPAARRPGPVTSGGDPG